MPEGDTLQLARRRLAPVLLDATVESFWACRLRGYRPRSGQRIEGLRVHGKHLIIDFDRDLSLQIHLGMAGSLLARPAGVPVQGLLADPRLRLHIQTEKGHALCLSAPLLRTFLRSAELTPTTNLGPDLVVSAEYREGVAREAAGRARSFSRGPTMIGEVLLDQRAAAGIGNVYKSEILFRHGIWPFRALSDIDDTTLVGLYRSASKLLWENSQKGGGPRTTTPHGRGTAANGLDRHYVYSRHRAPCLRCQTPISRSTEGKLGRSTYWCSRCQPPSPSEFDS